MSGECIMQAKDEGFLVLYNSDSNVFIESARLNGKDYTRTFLDTEVIQNGGNLKFTLNATPNPDWGSQPEDVPYSFSRIETP